MAFPNIFVSSEENRLRAGWRILAFFVLYGSVAFLLVSIGVLTGFIQLNGGATLGGDPVNLLKAKLLDGLALVAAVYAARRVLDKRGFESLGFEDRRAGRDLFAGIGIAAGLMGLIFLISLLAGWVNFEGFIWAEEPFSEWGFRLFIFLVLFVLVGLIEELQFRGYILQNLEDGVGKWGAVVLSSLIFAGFHLGNPDGFKWMSMVGLLLAGLFFAYAYLRTRTLWLTIGLHFGWNFFENPIFGLPVSGLNFKGLLVHTITGPEIWTGGAFGPEAGLVLIPALALGAVLIFLYTRERREGVKE